MQNSRDDRNADGVSSTLRNPRLQDAELQVMSDEGFALSMHQPWASLLVAGIKRSVPLVSFFSLLSSFSDNIILTEPVVFKTD